MSLRRRLLWSWPRQGPARWVRPTPHLAAFVLLVALVWPLPDGRAVGELAWSVAEEWAACVTTGTPPAPDWQHAARSPVEGAPPDTPLDEAWVQQRLGEDVPVEARLVSPRLATQPDYDPTTPDRPQQHPRTVKVAVIDSGVEADHPDVGKVARGLDLVAPCGDGRIDVTGHGTAVAGVITSQTYGAAPHVQILPVRVSLADGHHTPLQSAVGVVWAVNAGADIINLSFTNQRRGPSWLEHAALQWARSQGVGVVAAAGNNPDLPVGYPAAYPETLAVGSVDAGGNMSPFSATVSRDPQGLRGGGLDVVAPGARVVTLGADGSFKVSSGTSLAAPVVSATAAAMLLEDERLDGARAVERLRLRPVAPVEVMAQ